MGIRIAVITRKRQAEAMRIASGLLLLGDEAEVFCLETALSEDEETIAQLKICQDVDLPVYSDHAQAPKAHKIPSAQLREKLLQFDRILPILP